MFRSHATALVSLLSRNLLAWVVICLGLTLMAPQPARADWTYPGAQYSCNAQNQSFEVFPYEPTSEDPDLPPAPGFQPVNKDDPSITCTLGNHVVHAQVETVPANEHHCMGLGLVRVSSLTVQGVELVKDGSGGPFNFTCDSVAALKKIRVTLMASELVFEECYEPGDSWTTESPKAHCDTKRMNIDAMAATNAKVAHNLADAATQTAESATRLPPNNDLANVFGTFNSTPLCAHWKSLFGRHMPAHEPPPHGRIAGKVDERSYIHPANPQVCDAHTEPLCKAKDYLVAGDRVDVGFICGQWTYIRTIPATNLTEPTTGWIETNHLYEVDSLMTPNPIKNPLEHPPVVPRPGTVVTPDILTWLAMQDRAWLLDSSLDDGKWDPLVDLPAQMQRFLASAIRVNEPDRTGRTALFFATDPNNVDVAQLLLKSGANPNFVWTVDPGTYVPLPATTSLIAAVEQYKNHLDPTLIRLLLEAGANPNYRAGGEYVNVPADADDPSTGRQNLLAGVTALHVAAENGYLSICKLLLEHGADPHLPRSDGVLPAAIARNNAHKEVAALIDRYASHTRTAGSLSRKKLNARLFRCSCSISEFVNGTEIDKEVCFFPGEGVGLHAELSADPHPGSRP